MSNIEQIDFSTLIWVKKELDETLNRAQTAIEEYVENPEDENQLQFCATYLHQVQGTLKMVELYGAAMVAEEMEQVAKKILNKEVDSEKDAFEVLMRGIILLPDYLERIQLGYKDIPMVLLPLVNDLRTVKGDQLLSESALFNPDLSIGLPESAMNSSFKLSESQLNQVVKKIRSAYQVCLLNWIKDHEVLTNLKKIQIIVDKLKTVLTVQDEKQLFWVAGGLFEALISGGLEKSVTVKQLGARLDQAMRLLTESQHSQDKPYRKLTNSFLYYVALADSKDRRINEIQTFFRLSDFISDDVEIEKAQSSLSGKNRELLESVTSVIKEDLMSIQENLDLYNRNENADVTDLESIITSLRKISDTLGIIGIGVARSRIITVNEKLEENAKNGQRVSKDTIMNVAEVLLFVESSLDENILSLGNQEQKDTNDEDLIPSSEMKKIMDSLAKESINNLQKVKQNYVQFIEAPWNKESIESSPKLLKEIGGALKMSGLNDVAAEVDRVEEFTSKYMLEPNYKPTVDQLDLLAESVASLEYYLEYLSNGTKGEQSILNLAKSNIKLLFKSVEGVELGQKEVEALDADLDQMSDDEFDMELDMADDVDYEEESEEETYDQLLADESELKDEDDVNDVVDIEKNLEAEETEQEHNLIVSFSDDTDDDIKEVFLEEFEEELEHLNSIYPRWKKNPDDQYELLGEIRRIFHTLKGSGRLVGAAAIGDFSWKMEDLTNMILNKSQDVSLSYLLVMERSVELLPGLLESLQNESVVPNGYHLLVDAADRVANKETITEQDLIPVVKQEIQAPESEQEAQEDASLYIDEDMLSESDTEEEPNLSETTDTKSEDDNAEDASENDNSTSLDDQISQDSNLELIEETESDDGEHSLELIDEEVEAVEPVEDANQSIDSDLAVDNSEELLDQDDALSLLPLEDEPDQDTEDEITDELPEVSEQDLSADNDDINGLTLEPLDDDSTQELDEQDETNDIKDESFEFDDSTLSLDPLEETEESQDEEANSDDNEYELDSKFDFADGDLALEPLSDSSNDENVNELDLEIELEGLDGVDATELNEENQAELSDDESDSVDDLELEIELESVDAAEINQENQFDLSEGESEAVEVSELEIELDDFESDFDVTELNEESQAEPSEHEADKVEDLELELELEASESDVDAPVLNDENQTEPSDDQPDGVDDLELEIELDAVDQNNFVDEVQTNDLTEENQTLSVGDNFDYSKIENDSSVESDQLDFDETTDDEIDKGSIEESNSNEDLSVDPVFVEILQQEVEGHLKDIEEFVNTAKASENNQSTEKFIRVVHTLNGAANMASVDSIVAMTTPLELAAKLTSDMNKDFSTETVEKILELKNEASDIMKDLSNRSQVNEVTSNLGEYFKGVYAALEESSNHDVATIDDTPSEFDLSQFIDGTDADSTSDEKAFDNNDLSNDVDYDLHLTDETIEDSLDEELSIEDINFNDQSDVDEGFASPAIEEEPVQEEETDSGDFTEIETQEDGIEQSIIDDIEADFAEIDGQSNDAIDQEEKAWHDSSPVISMSYAEGSNTNEENVSEIDEELLEIFKEEADDILDRTEHVLSDLEENPKDLTLIVALQRDLHTLKGGARMAGLENIGELSHVLESLLEIISEDGRNIDVNILHAIQDAFDQLNRMKEEKDFGQSYDINPSLNHIKHLVGLDDAAIPEESKLDQVYFDPAATDVAEELDDTVEKESVQKKSNVLSGNQIKVNSELLDNLVNYAGEVSIYRSRLEQEVGSFRVNLSELGNTVARIKEQLRKLDVETEAQIMSTFQTSNDHEGFDPLEMDRFSQLQQLSRSLAESVSDLTSIHSYLDDVARTSDNLLMQQSRVNTELQEGLMETRLVSFNSIVPRMRRLIRTTSKELNKPVRMEVHGAEGEMDKTVLEGVIAPLEHMLRNALAHGIEKDRTEHNKPAEGTIIIDVRREATEVVITVADDGAGINRKRVQEIAEKKGLIKPGMKLRDENIDRLILNSGFSTVEEVSKLAGRGVGMDVVSNQINLLGGSLDISSETNVGTKFHIRLPYTLALSSALLVEIAEVIYAIPVSGLEGIIRMPYDDYKQNMSQANYIYEYVNEEYLVQELDKLLDLDSEVVIENNQIPLVMIRSGNQGVALRVDRILGSREIVVKTVGSQISSVPGIYGATILGDGNVVLILDIIPLSRSYIKKLESLDYDAELYAQEEIEKDPIVMIVDDSITMRKVGERILRRNNYDVVTAKDGLDALDNLKEVIPDVMLLDIEMPRMDGYELAIEMKKEEKYAGIPIIMITSRTGEKHRQKAIDLGVDRYLGKPYQEADLLENISDLIEQSKG